MYFICSPRKIVGLAKDAIDGRVQSDRQRHTEAYRDKKVNEQIKQGIKKRRKEKEEVEEE